MNLQLLGVNHRTAPVEVRERLAIPESKLPQALQQLMTVPGVNEAIEAKDSGRAASQLAVLAEALTRAAQTLESAH